MKKSLLLIAFLINSSVFSAIATRKEINESALRVLISNSSKIFNENDKSQSFADLLTSALTQGYNHTGVLCENSGVNYKCDLVVTNIPLNLDTSYEESLIITFYVESYPNGLPSKVIGNYSVSLL
ncbi:MAG: hypothetical protein K9K67_14985 [Bacteriovoracaceae bacterium]|nr:hypothetical protein [Bacteriovoracaceae bacterium]